VGRPYIIRIQRHNWRLGLEVYPARFTRPNSLAPSTDLLPNGSFHPNGYLIVTASFVRESASAGLHVVSQSTWTRYLCLTLIPPNIKNPDIVFKVASDVDG
jgi:hypothetical protein